MTMDNQATVHALAEAQQALAQANARIAELESHVTATQVHPIHSRSDFSDMLQPPLRGQGSEDQFRLLVEKLEGYAIYLTDPTGVVTSWNRGAERLMYYTADEILGQHFSLFFDLAETAAGEPQRLLAEAAANGRVEAESWQFRKDGTRFWGKLELLALRYPNGVLHSFAFATGLAELEHQPQQAATGSPHLVRSLLDDAAADPLRFYTSLQKSITEAVIVTDLAFRITSWNQGAEAIYGWRADEAIGQIVSQLLQSRLLSNQAFDTVNQALLARGHTAQELLERRKDGTDIYILASVTNLTDEHNVPTGRVIIARDITERKMAVKNLQAKANEEHEFQQHLKALQEVTIELTMIDELDHFYRRAVELGLERFGFERMGLLLYDESRSLAIGTYGTDARGQVIAESHLQLDPANFTGILQRTLNRTERFTFDEHAALFDNLEPIGFGWNAVAVLWNGTQSLGWLCADNGVQRKPASQPLLEILALYSLTLGTLLAHKRLEVDLREKHDELERANQAKDRFLASMSHELRTPLNAIIGYTGTLLMKLPGPLTADQERQLRTIQSSSKHLLSLISDLLDLAKIESGKIELTLEALDCHAIFEEVASLLRPLANTKGIHFVVTPPPEATIICSDRRALSQIILNLGNNAIKFTEEGEVKLEWMPQPEQDWVAIQVTDTGMGIRPEEQTQLFQAFAQVGAVDKRQEGAGLGLYLSQRLAELLGGQITFHSVYGKGSTFMLKLPITWPSGSVG